MVGWPFFLSYNKTHSKTLPASDISIDDVLHVFHDPPALAGLNPLVTKCEALDPSKPNFYTIHDDLRIFGLFKVDTVYTVNFSPTNDGTDTEVNAGLGTTLSQQWRVKEKEESQEVEISEKVTVRCIFLFLPFILATITGAHSRLLEALTEKVIAETKAPELHRYINMFPYIAILVGLASLWYLEAQSSFIYTRISSSSFAVVCILVMTVSLLWRLYDPLLGNRDNDPYGLFHLSLNKRSGEDENDSPKTEWLNMGYWKVNIAEIKHDFHRFETKPLALKLIQAANCKEGGSLLDVGHGTGESLILLLTHPFVPRPGHLTGITSLPLHHERSLERLKRLAPATDTKISLHAGDAVYKQESSATDHPLNPSSSARFDSILALDCAYHFRTRETFLCQAFRQLSPAGRIALADICFANELPMNWQARVIRRVLRLMPRENVISINEYVGRLEQIGYEDVKVEDISEDVFPGFVSFLKPRGLGWWIFGSVLCCYYKAGARFVIASGSRT
ncbi:S-adenosyl-L-methionine-dependent methyltransferase [Lentinula guzmanii]|uniref:phosphoethanolamine N-methyltransferase n=1 Tax=Lentinula guzmanii TaxID=2804957 RepID=A0AA38JJR0_9AGAR|nr:S-adenosyl-L-methionine-dependent methyltransferase [Lentinula guzmanii]